MVGHRAAVSLADDAVPVIFGCGAQPDCDRGAAQQRVCLRRGDDAATGGEDHRAARSEDLVERLALEAAVVVLAVEREELRQTEVGCLFDSPIELNERHAKPAGEAAANGGLAGP